MNDELKKTIEVKNVTKGFNLAPDRKYTLRQMFTDPFSQETARPFTAVNNVSFDVEEGEFIGIIGRNGSGKSTLLKMLAGIYEPDTGQIIVRGNVVPFLELGVGFNYELSAKENVYLNGTILGLTRKEIDEKIDEIIEFAEVGEFVNLPLKNFSSGMAVRLAFSIAINVKADVYLVDEVLAVGDALFQKKCYEIFKGFKKSMKTVILVTHDMNSIREYCNRAILIHDHEVRADGKPDDVIKIYDEINRTES
jgi:ABC-type polysaccharide/polyol phosphate transport system ATPase subunit